MTIEARTKVTISPKDWFSPSAMEQYKMLEARGSETTKQQLLFQLHFQSFNDFEAQLLFHHGLHVQQANTVDSNSFWKVVYLKILCLC